MGHIKREADWSLSSMKSSFLSTENILHTYILILFVLLGCFDYLVFFLPPLMKVLELQRQHNSYVLLSMPEPAHCEWGTTSGEWGRTWRGFTHEASLGDTDCWGSNWAVKTMLLSTWDHQHQLSSRHVSAKFSEESIQPSNKCACQTSNFNPASSMLCSAGYRQGWAQVWSVLSYRDGVPRAWLCSSNASIQLSVAWDCLSYFTEVHHCAWWHLLCTQLLPPTLCGDMGLQETFPFHGSCKPQYHYTRKTLTLFLKMHFSFPPCCVSSLSSLSIPSNQTWQKQHGAVCYDLTQTAFANHFQLPAKEQFTCCFQTPFFSFSIFP